MALHGFPARGSPYTVRVLALKLEEEGDEPEVCYIFVYYLPRNFIISNACFLLRMLRLTMGWNKFLSRTIGGKSNC